MACPDKNGSGNGLDIDHDDHDDLMVRFGRAADLAEEDIPVLGWYIGVEFIKPPEHYIICPGCALHRGTSAAKDCLFCLVDGWPVIRCVHDECAQKCAQMTQRLRKITRQWSREALLRKNWSF